MIIRREFYINGAWVAPAKARDCAVINPSNEEEIAIISLGDQADTDAVLQQCGAISAEEIRGRLSNDPQSEYTGLDVDDLPQAPGGELPEDVGGGLL